jgi:hypothetical protein
VPIPQRKPVIGNQQKTSIAIPIAIPIAIIFFFAKIREIRGYKKGGEAGDN